MMTTTTKVMMTMTTMMTAMMLMMTMMMIWGAGGSLPENLFLQTPIIPVVTASG